MAQTQNIYNQEFIQDGINQAVEGILKAINNGEFETGYHTDSYVSLTLWDGQEAQISVSDTGIMSISTCTKNEKIFKLALRRALQDDANRTSSKMHELNEKLQKLDKEIAQL